MSGQKTGAIALAKALVVAGLVAAVGLVVYAKRGASRDQPETAKATETSVVSPSPRPSVADMPDSPPTADVASHEPARVPRLVDLGADKCVPCKAMAPILKELKATYAGRMQVDFIDIWKNPDAGKQYDIGLIPTQIFYDASGKELFRHEGFFSKEDILAKWGELGVSLGEAVGSSRRSPLPSEAN